MNRTGSLLPEASRPSMLMSAAFASVNVRVLSAVAVKVAALSRSPSVSLARSAAVSVEPSEAVVLASQATLPGVA